MKKTIGKVTKYTGTEHRYMNGYTVRIVAVLHNAAKPDFGVDGADYDNISDDIDLERVGGVTAFDRVEVQPWLEKENRFSFVSSDPLATDLICFKNLTHSTDR